MSTFKMTIQEFSQAEHAFGVVDFNGSEEFEFSRFADGELAIRVWRDGEAGVACRLGEWVASEVAAMREDSVGTVGP